MQATSPDNSLTSAEARLRKKEAQLREGEKAMAEYIVAGAAEREKTARLRALREAKEAAEAEKLPGEKKTGKPLRRRNGKRAEIENSK